MHLRISLLKRAITLFISAITLSISKLYISLRVFLWFIAAELIIITVDLLTFPAIVVSGQPSSNSFLSRSININIFVMDAIMWHVDAHRCFLQLFSTQGSHTSLSNHHWNLFVFMLSFKRHSSFCCRLFAHGQVEDLELNTAGFIAHGCCNIMAFKRRRRRRRTHPRLFLLKRFSNRWWMTPASLLHQPCLPIT